MIISIPFKRCGGSLSRDPRSRKYAPGLVRAVARRFGNGPLAIEADLPENGHFPAKRIDEPPAEASSASGKLISLRREGRGDKRARNRFAYFDEVSLPTQKLVE
jgi:hypothetical protein